MNKKKAGEKMGEKQKTLPYTLDGDKIVITSVRATARIGILRFRMMQQAEIDNQTEEDESLKPLRMFSYPDCICCSTVTKNGKPWDIDFKTFSDELPESLIDQWISLVLEINPHWRGKKAAEAGEDAEEKKAD